jgi:hypothetical protein
MTTIADLVWFITSDPDFKAMAADRLNPITLPQDPIFPAVTYFRVSRPHQHTHDGGEVVWPMYQFDCYGSTYLGAWALANLVDDILGRWKSAYGQPAFGESMRDIPEPDLPPVGARFRVMLEATIWGLV